jgi:type VI protein secretion system component Hcp
MLVDIFLELTGPRDKAIKGESRDKHFRGLVEIDDFELSARSMKDFNNAKRKEEAEGGDVDRLMYEEKSKKSKKKKSKSQTFDDSQVPLKSDGEDENANAFTLKITKDMDYVSPDLAQSYSRNLAGMRQEFPKIRLYLRKRGTENFVYLTFTFKDCYVVNYHLALSGGGTSIPVETVEITFSHCAMKYVPQTKEGGVAPQPMYWGWDFANQKSDDSIAH